MLLRTLIFVLAFLSIAHHALAQRVTSGYVLTHEHPTYGMAFGGNYAFAGAPGNYKHGIMEKGYTAYCGGCKVLGTCDHGEVKGSYTAFTGSLGGDMGDHGSYMGPLHDSNSHLRYSTEWIKEAFAPTESDFQDTSLKIMVALAVENEAMCEQLYSVNKGNGGAGGDGFPCTKGDSWPSLKRQLDNLKAWVAENSDWMQIAYSATQARQIVNAGKLAIVLGIESEYAFGSEASTFDPVARLDKYYEEGVRTFYLAHKINSRLSGADIYMPRESGGGRAIRMTQAISGCFYYDDNVGHFPLEGRLGENLCDNTNSCGANAFKGGKIADKCSYRFSEISEANLLDYYLRGAGAFDGFDLYPLPPAFTNKAVSFSDENHAGSHLDDHGIERNNLGLSHDGERVVREAMIKGMIVNLDHVSSLARKHIYALATEVFDNYPLNALHNKPNQRLTGAKKFEQHEYDLDEHELGFIRETGGFFGLRMGPTAARDYPQSGITAHCPNTSTETAKMLAWLIDQGLSVGYSLDYATVTEGVHSRTMYSCGLELGDDRIHQYDGHDAEGLSHIGMMKKWYSELEAIRLEQRYLDILAHNGVEQFLHMWEKSAAKAKTGQQIPRVIFARETVATGCKEDSECADGEYCDDPISGKKSCKALLSRGHVCTGAFQCASNRCPWGVCADPDECRANSDCDDDEYCGAPIAGKRSCKMLKSHGQACTDAVQCDTGRCSWGFCADADECRSNADCAKNQRCGDPISGKRTCKDLLTRGQACIKSSQCASDKCSLFRCT